MKRWLYPLVGLLAIAFLSGKGTSRTDVAKLRPVEVVVVTCSEKIIKIQTDTGDVGVGEDLTQAVEQLKTTTPAEIFLETAEYLLISEECRSMVPELMEYLRPSCSVCILEGEPEMDNVGTFLKIHGLEVTLTEYKAGLCDLQTLREKEGRLELVS